MSDISKVCKSGTVYVSLFKEWVQYSVTHLLKYSVTHLFKYCPDTLLTLGNCTPGISKSGLQFSKNINTRFMKTKSHKLFGTQRSGYN